MAQGDTAKSSLPSTSNICIANSTTTCTHQFASSLTISLTIRDYSSNGSPSNNPYASSASASANTDNSYQIIIKYPTSTTNNIS